MSAIRNTNARRAHRSSLLPYARPTGKKSTWSFMGLLSYLNPLRSRLPIENDDYSLDEDEVEQTPSKQHSDAAQSLSARGHQMDQDISIHGRVNALAGPSSQLRQSSVAQPHDASELPATPTRSGGLYSPQDSPSSPGYNIDTVSHILSERAGKQISNSEVEGLLAFLQTNTPQADKPEPFRFSISPSTPARGSSPSHPNTNGIRYSFDSPASQTSTPSPRKSLSRNPNGVYRWEGVGSAKAARSRNRYSSPAFGPSRTSSGRLVLKESQATGEALISDTKRRKVGHETQSSSAPSSAVFSGANAGTSRAPPRSPAPVPSPNRTAQALPFPKSSDSPAPSRPSVGSSSPAPLTNATARLRTPVKPSAPVVPSPLRQAWSGSSSASRTDSPPAALQKPTKAANFMTELIKEVTPPKRPDLSNPYQTASPVGKVTLPKTRVGKRTRTTGKPTVHPATDDKSKEPQEPGGKEKEYSPQAIIEATLPKGSKRSRPPIHFEKPSSSLNHERPSESKESSKASSYIVEEADDDEEESERAPKRSKLHPNEAPKSSPLPSEIVIEEMDDVDVQTPIQKPQIVIPGPVSVFGSSGSATSSSKASGRPSFPAFKPTLPKEPSKLRFSYQPEPGGSSPAPALAPAASLADVPSSQNLAAQAAEVKEEKKVDAPKKTPKEVALAMSVDALPTFIFSVTTTLTFTDTPSYLKAMEEAKSIPKSSLPSFDFNLPTPNSNVEAPKPLPPPVKGFDWSAAGIKKPATPDGGSWTCSTCMLSNPATAVDQCSICQSSR